MPKAEYKDFKLDVKEIGEDGTFEGYGSVFGVMDFGNDVVEKGAFKETLVDIENTGRKVPILWQHDWREPIGVYDDIQEDDRGLYLKGRLFLEVGRAKDAYTLIKGGAVSGLSIGYKATKWEYDEDEHIRYLKSLELMEVSLVTFPMLDDARVSTVKGELPTIREFERILRDVGFSKKQSVEIANHGLSPLLRREAADGVQNHDQANIAEALKAFEIPTNLK